jgi:putative MFS transporter
MSSTTRGTTTPGTTTAGTGATVTGAQLAARLDRLPMTRHIWYLVTLISLGGGFELYDLFLTAYLAPG